MPRVSRGNKRIQRRKKILKLAKGYRLTKSKLHRSAGESVERGLRLPTATEDKETQFSQAVDRAPECSRTPNHIFL